MRSWISFTDGEKNKSAEKTIRYSGLDAMDEESATASICYKTEGIWQITEPYNQKGYMLYDLPEAGTTTEVGEPMLIREGLYVVVPPGKKFSRLKVTYVTETDLNGEHDIIPVPKPAHEKEDLEFIKNETLYKTDSSYPYVYAEFIGQEQVLGIKCAHLYIYPMHYRPKSKIVTAAKQIEIKIWFEDDPSTDELSKEASSNFHKEALDSLLLGYSDIYKTVTDPKPKMVIITTEELQNSMKAYEAAKAVQYDVETVLTKDIYTKYQGKSNDEAILAFLMDKYDNDKISYVVLGGDVNQIPTHKDKNNFASDSYYCTDGKTVSPRFPLSRFPARNNTELKKQADTASCYNKHYDEQIRHTAIFTAYGKNNRKDYIQCKEDIDSSLDKAVFTVKKCYDDGKGEKDKLISAINEGAAFINYRGHGDDTEWQSSNGLDVNDIPDLDVKTNTPIVLSIACNTNNLLVNECFGACWIRNEKAVAFLGASEGTYTTINDAFDKYLWEAIKNGSSVIGDIYVWATTELYRNYCNESTEENIREYLLLGDVSADYLAKDVTL